MRVTVCIAIGLNRLRSGEPRTARSARIAVTELIRDLQTRSAASLCGLFMGRIERFIQDWKIAVSRTRRHVAGLILPHLIGRLVSLATEPELRGRFVTPDCAPMSATGRH
jgi:hypothetical protein